MCRGNLWVLKEGLVGNAQRNGGRITMTFEFFSFSRILFIALLYTFLLNFPSHLYKKISHGPNQEKSSLGRNLTSAPTVISFSVSPSLHLGFHIRIFIFGKKASEMARLQQSELCLNIVLENLLHFCYGLIESRLLSSQKLLSFEGEPGSKRVTLPN